MTMRTIRGHIRKGDTHYVAECLDVNVVTQGVTLDETVRNLQEALELYFEGEDLRELGFEVDPVLLLTIELPPVAHAA
jgi:predicted RNase H-like HicB family nuclease